MLSAVRWPQVSVVGIDFAPARGLSFDQLLARRNGDGRNPHVDLATPLLIVYTSGTTGRPKGAVLRQEALVCNAAMSHHLHGMTGDGPHPHGAAVLPCRRAQHPDHAGAAGRRHGGDPSAVRARRDACGARATSGRRLTVLVPTTIQALLAHPAWPDTDLSSLRAITTGSVTVPQPLIDAITGRGVPVLQVYGATETCPIAIYTRLGGDLQPRQLHRTAGPALRSARRR